MHAAVDADCRRGCRRCDAVRRSSSSASYRAHGFSRLMTAGCQTWRNHGAAVPRVANSLLVLNGRRLFHQDNRISGREPLVMVRHNQADER